MSARWGIRRGGAAPAVLSAVLAAALVAGCGTTVGGTAVIGGAPTGQRTTSPGPPTTGATTQTTGSSGGSTSTVSPSTGTSTTGSTSHALPDSAVGLKPDAPQAKLVVTGDGGTVYDTIAKDAIDDLYTFYTGIFPATFDDKFVPPRHLLSYDSNDKKAAVCGTSEYQDANAAYYHPPCDTVAWDRGVLLPQLSKDIGVLAPAVVLSHEMGHDVQFQVGMNPATSTIVLEQQADCYAGAYWKWVAEGNSKYFNFNQTEGMRQLLLTLYQGHDPVGSSGAGDEDHGNGFDRTFAVTLGYNDGAKRCSQINQKEIDARGQEFPFQGLPHNYGNLDITADSMTSIAAVVNEYFKQTAPGYQAPKLTTFSGKTAVACKGTTATYPVDYCPATNTVSYNLAELQRIGTPTAGWDSVNGDFSAIILLVSRYALAAQAAGHSPVTGTNAGLRALCYAGTWATWMRNPQGTDGLQLSPNDLDKAIYEIVSSPLAASDTNGQTGAPLIDRVTAFGTGVTEPITTCFHDYPG
jgi:predicted metalloprotease